MSHDLVVSVRALAKRPGYAFSVIVTLALGIGASTAMFSLLDASVLRPLPFHEPDRIVYMMGVAGPQRAVRGGSMPEIADWRALNTTLENVAIYDNLSLNLRAGDEAIRVDTEMVSATFFPLLGKQAALGRTFLPDEDAVPDAKPVAVISDKLWRERFGADPAVLNQSIVLNDRTFAIVGVMPRDFTGLSFSTDVWIPSMMVTVTSAPAIVQARGTRWLAALARLKDGVSIERAQEDMTRVAALLEKAHPDTNRERGVQVQRLHDAVVGSTGRLLAALFGGVLIFLAVACANVASLQLVRATARRREVAVRIALGARRWHVLRQLLAESLIASTVAAVIGALLAAWGVAAVARLVPAGTLPAHAAPSIDFRALAFTFAVAIVSGVVVAVLPLVASRGGDVAAWLKEGARSSTGGLGTLKRVSAQQALVVGEIALAMTLLTAAGLMARSLQRQLDVRLGFDARGVTAARVTLPASRYAPEQRLAFVERLAERLKTLPLVRSAAIGSDLPLTGSSSAGILVPEGAPQSDVRYYRHYVTPTYFETLAIPIRRGRGFGIQDRQGAPLVAIISESGARRIWGSDDAVGRRIRVAPPPAPPVEIVGIAGDVRYRDLTTDLSGARVEPDLYFSFAQRTDRELQIAVRSADGAPVALSTLQQAVAAVDAGLPVYQVRPLTEAVRQQTASARFGSVLLGLFSAGALLLAAIGLYGLVAYVVGLSQREIAVRMALGADPTRVVLLIVRNGMALVAVGIAVGSMAAWLAGRSLESQLFRTRAFDPVTFLVVGGTLLLVSLAASVAPARRAARLDAQRALRAE